MNMRSREIKRCRFKVRECGAGSPWAEVGLGEVRHLLGEPVQISMWQQSVTGGHSATAPTLPLHHNLICVQLSRQTTEGYYNHTKCSYGERMVVKTVRFYGNPFVVAAEVFAGEWTGGAS
jgi:hypothetical protein